MAENNYQINYDDERFKAVENEKQDRLNEVNNTYNAMVNQSDAFYQSQINAAKDYANTQQDLQNQQTDLAINEINQAKDKANRDYLREQRGAYSDWQKESNRYGVNAEQQAASGLRNTGYSESSQVSMYNTYQNRVSTARDSYNLAVQNYDNKIAEARLANNSKLAEIAYKALQTELELSLSGFQYKNTLLLDQVNKQNEINNTYYARWQNVLGQMNTENALAEQIRQYNERMAYQRERDAVADAQWQKEFDLAKKAASSSRRSGSSGGGTSYGGNLNEGGNNTTTETKTGVKDYGVQFDSAKPATTTQKKSGGLIQTAINGIKSLFSSNKSSSTANKATSTKLKFADKTPSFKSAGAKAAWNSKLKGKGFASKADIDKAIKGYTISSSEKQQIYKAFGF